MANATIFPNLNRFQWSRPEAPNPRLAAPVSAVATTLTFTNPPKDQNGAVITGNFLMGVKNAEGYTETVYVPAAAMSLDGLTATGVVRGIRLTGLDYTTGDSSLAAAHGQDSAVYCNITAIDFLMMQAALQGDIASGGTEWRIGDETDETITIYAQNADANKPAWRYNKTTNEWEYSNDGVAFQPFGTGSGLTASTGAVINSGDIQVNLADTTTFRDERTGNEARGVVTKATDGKIDPSFLSFATANNIDATANTTLSSGDAVAFDGIGRLVKADGNDVNPFGLFGGTATSAGTAGNAMTYASSGVVSTSPVLVTGTAITQASSNGSDTAINSINQWRAQTFVMPTNATNPSYITEVTLNFFAVSSPVMTLVAEIRDVVGGQPGSTVYQTSEGVTTITATNISFPFLNPALLTGGTSYAIVWRPTSYTSGSATPAFQNSNIYADGIRLTSTNAGSSWTTTATDYRFSVTTEYAGSETFSLSERQACRLWNGESNATSNTTTDTIGATTQWRAQIFVPQTGQDNVSRVTLNMTNASLSGTGSVQIYAVSGTNPNAIPTGVALGTSSDVASWTTGDIDFNFTTPIAVTPGTAYAIVFRLTAFTSGTIAWNYNNADVYANGNSATSADSGSSWTAEATFDRRFTVQYRGLAGEAVFLSNDVGRYSLTPGTYINPIGQALATNQIVLKQNLKFVYATFTATLSATGTVETTISTGLRPVYIMGDIQIDAQGGGVSPGFGQIYWTPGGSSVWGSVTTYNATEASRYVRSWTRTGEIRDTAVTTFYPSAISITSAGNGNVVVSRTVAGSTTSRDLTIKLYIIGV